MRESISKPWTGCSPRGHDTTKSRTFPGAVIDRDIFDDYGGCCVGRRTREGRSTGAETADATLYRGRRLWPGAEVWINDEIDQGAGLDDTLGVAGFPSGEAYKVGKNQPYLHLPRLFVRQTLDIGGAPESIEAAANQLGGTQSANRVVITVGKFSVGDIFDTNSFSHDPRNDFLIWTAIDAGTFDYAAVAWGYTVGAAMEWYRNSWTLRGGLFDLSDVAHLAFDYQWINHPAYNRDRGPASVLAVRLHAQF